MTHRIAFRAGRAATLLLLAAAATLLAPRIAAAYPVEVTTTELVEKAAGFDGRFVTFEGEVIGDVMVRGAGAWVNVSDGQTALGVWAPAAQARLISTPGGPKAYGEIVRVAGTFHSSWARHGGDLAVEASELRVVGEARPISHAVNRSRLVAAAVLLPIAAVMAALSAIVGRRQARGEE